MIAVYILLVLLLLLILWVLFTPVYIRVNTDLDEYEIIQAGTMKVAFHPGRTLAIEVRIFGFGVPIGKGEKTTGPPEKKKRKRPGKRSSAAWRFLMRGIYRSFTLRRFVCTVDLDDVVMAAKLVPIILLLNRGAVSFHTNYSNRNFLLLEIEGRLNTLLWTFIRFFTKNKNYGSEF
jgi:hypothetical protein